MKTNGFWQWLVRSSANPASVSATIKGVTLLLVPLTMAFLQLKGVTLPDGAVADTFNGIGSVISVAFGLVGAVYTAFGLLRKLYYAIKK